MYSVCTHIDKLWNLVGEGQGSMTMMENDSYSQI
jgi:hypothetical protein